MVTDFIFMILMTVILLNVLTLYLGVFLCFTLILLMEREEQAANLHSKYNLEAMSAYNFANVDFDINFGEVSEKDMDKMKKE